jgi:hypothetical protein
VTNGLRIWSIRECTGHWAIARPRHHHHITTARPSRRAFCFMSFDHITPTIDPPQECPDPDIQVYGFQFVPDDPTPNLTSMALSMAIKSIQTFQGASTNRVGAAQAEALYLFLVDAAKKLHGVTTGRTAFGIDTGGGKSTAIAAFIACQWVAGHMRTRGLAVACNHIKALCLMRDKLITYAAEIADDIGLSHADLTGTYTPTNTPEELQARPILLATHARAKGGHKSAAIFTRYRDEDRQLTLWDEGLIGSKGLTLDWSNFERAIHNLDSLPADGPALPFLQESRDRIAAELAAQAADASRPVAALSLMRLADLKAVDRELAALSGRDEYTKKAVHHARHFVDMAQYDVAPARLQDGQAVIGIRLEVPADIANVCILDASVSIRLLETMDPSIRVAQLPPGIKTYEAVTINRARHSSARGGTQDDLSKRGHSFNKAMLMEAATRAEAEGQPLLCVTFKDDSLMRYQATLARALGPLATAKLPGGRPLVRWLTWGNHDSLNEYADCRHVVLCGILHLPADAVAANMAAQAGTLTLSPSTSEVRKVVYSEVAHAVYQAMSRGHCRIIDNGKAGAMTLWMSMATKDADGYLKDILPGAVWNCDYWPAGLQTKAEAKAKTAKKTTASKAVQAGAEKIAAYLREAERVPVASRVVREATDLTTDMFTRAAKVAAEALVFEWDREGLMWTPV